MRSAELDKRHMPAALESYTNFIGPQGFTYCVEGIGSTSPANQPALRTSIVYRPATEAPRVRITEGAPQQKRVLDGSFGEEDNLQDDELRQTAQSLYTVDEQTGARIIAVPAHEIDRIFSPTESMSALFNEQIPEIPVEIGRKVQVAIGYLLSIGIPFVDLGLYGGLQSFVVHKGEIATLKDIDVTVRGLEYAELVHRKAHENWIYRQEGLQTRTKQVNLDIRERRHQNTRIYVPEAKGLYCDIKIVRKPTDVLSLTPDIKASRETVALQGYVINAAESLSSPMSFEMMSNRGDRQIISSTKYDYIGAVCPGDLVTVRAATTNKPDNYLLTDPSLHTITYHQASHR